MTTSKSRALPPVPLLADSGLSDDEINKMAYFSAGDRALAALARRTPGVWYDPPERVEAGEEDYDEEAFLDRGEEPPTHITIRAATYVMPHHVLAAAVVLGGKPGPLITARSLHEGDVFATIVCLPKALAWQCAQAWNRTREPGAWDWIGPDSLCHDAEMAASTGADPEQVRATAEWLAGRLRASAAA